MENLEKKHVIIERLFYTRIIGGKTSLPNIAQRRISAIEHEIAYEEDELSDKKIVQPTTKFLEQFEESERLEGEIRKNLSRLGFTEE